MGQCAQVKKQTSCGRGSQSSEKKQHETRHILLYAIINTNEVYLQESDNIFHDKGDMISYIAPI